jgi:hypothetical protein
MVEVRSKRCLGRTETDREISKRAVVVEVEEKRTTKTTLRSARKSLLKKYLTGPTLLEMSGNACRLRRSTQHLHEVYPREFQSPAFSSDVEKRAIGPCVAGNIAAAAGWYFRLCLVARDSADRRSTPARPSLP